MQLSIRVSVFVAMIASYSMSCLAACDECGCTNECSNGKICKLICEQKTVNVICYKCEDEDFCIPDPSCKGCKHCETVCADACGSCECDNGCTQSPKGRRFVWFSWKPSTARLATKRKLFTKTVKKKIPSYKWVVVDRCECGACATKFTGRDTGIVKKAPPGLKAGQTLEVSDKELQRLASSNQQAKPSTR